jgi:drug/metabolite transporter (DMT)-like permease
VALVALSACAFGAMAIFGVWAYHAGTSIWALLVVRFGVAAVLMGALVRLRRIRLPPLRRSLVLAAMGGLGYVGQSFCYFVALQYAQASLVALLLYLYPAFVVILAATFLRERLGFAVVSALALALLGTSLVVGGGSGGLIGIVLALGAAVIYSVYITVGAVATAGLDPLAVTAVVCASAAGVSALGAVVQTVLGDRPSFPGSPAGWGSLLAIAVVCTVVAILAFFAGLQRLGASRTAVLSTLEPVVTVGLATWLLAESLSVVQLTGGVLVLVAVGWQATVRRAVPAAEAAARLDATPPI